jgi:hypothetical protein
MSLHDTARHVLSTLCDEHYDGFGLVLSYSATTERIPRRRHHARERELTRVADGAKEVATHLHEGGDAASAAELIATADLKDAVRVTRGYPELLDAVVERFRAGDNVWDGDADSGDMIVLRFWHDSTHRRVSDPYPSIRRS